MDDNHPSWLTDVIKTLQNLGGKADYTQIYKEAKNIRLKRGATWPPTAEAIIRRVLEEQSSDTTSFKGRDIFYSVDGIGNGVWGLRTLKCEFQIGDLYNRQKDIHAKFGGSRQSGISTCKNFPYIFLFTGTSGEQYGYGSDGWDEDGIFNYTGEGQIGDMQFSDGNKAIRDHVQNGRDLYLFQFRKKGEAYRFMGQFVCVGYATQEIPDREQQNRKGIVFKLKNVDETDDDFVIDEVRTDQNDIVTLRQKAYAAVSEVKEVSSAAGKQSYYKRSRDIKLYVLSRANGFCECCGRPAPFIRKDGTPYLEPHHIFKLSDKGQDHPKMMAAITPNCHREIHFGQSGEEIDKRLASIIEKKENLADT